MVMSAGSGGRFIEFTNDYRVFFSEENPELQAFEEMQNIYTKTDNVLFVIEPEGTDVFNFSTLNMIAELTESSWQIPYSTRVDSITNYQHTLAKDDDLLVGDLVDSSTNLSLEDISYVRGVALKEPLLVKRLISPSGHVTGVNVTIQLPGKSLTEVPEVAQFSRELKSKLEASYPNHRIPVSYTHLTLPTIYSV